jgi:hypothetical protein
MANKLLKYKRLVLLGIFMGILSFSVCHASVMPQSMDGMDCQAQTFCVACPVPVPVTSESPDLSNFLMKFDNLSETPSFLPDPIRDSFYHPPR